ncbi:carbohydrate kinase family protein [Blautia schinkii]|nr:carbohydrate kinase family protein [Blautia schinkii]
MADILCVGQMVADILVQSVDEVNFSTDTKRVDKILINNGGDCLNTAIDLSKLGAKVGFIGAVGQDPLGSYLQNVLKNNGIDDSGLYVDKTSQTSSVVALINSAGERVFLYYGGTNDILSFENVNKEMIADAKIVHVGGTFQLPGLDGEGTRQLFKTAHEHGCFTTMDVTWDTSGKWLDIIEPCLPELDLFMPSINEAKEICKCEEVEKIAESLKERGVKNVIIKLGKQGCYVDAFGKRYYQSPFKVPVVDTTGAGDAFVAGVLYGLHMGWEIERVTRFASAVSAHCIQELGATVGVPEYEKVLDFINEN